MRSFYRRTLVWVAGGALLALGGCVTNQQFTDFTRTQVARVVSDLFGQAIRTFVQATT
ncbi:MAG: hypothetical protein IPM18_04485 [Phycisphaerales bacterium]|nr:hypothetical protein [Phycisphaerales bacterium]